MPKTPKKPIVAIPAENTISVGEAARLLRRAPSSIRESLKEGRLGGKKVLGRWEVYQVSVARALNGEPQERAA